MKGRSGLALALACAASAWGPCAISAFGQSAISAHSGMVHYVEGMVLLDGQQVDPKFGEFPEVKNDQVLKAEEGRAEVLLTPGVFLRLAENSSFRMLSNRLSDTAIEVLSGSVMFEVDELLKDNAITVKYQDATVALTKDGLYRVEADPARLKVYEGAAQVIYGTKTVEAHKGHQVALDETLLASSFDAKDTDSFYRWASRRSEYVAAANVSSARSAGCNSFAASTTNCGGLGSYGGYGSTYGNPYGMWAWNPYFGMFTYLPGAGFGYNPFGWAFYSPYTVGMLYVPGYYGYGYPGAPAYTNVGRGPTTLAGVKPSLGATNSIGSPLRTGGLTGPTTSNNGVGSAAGTGRSSAPLNGGGGGGVVSAAPVGGGGVSAGSGGLGGARSAGGGGHK